jgi:16S rRNA (cytidine1402-2'-O)-methyltransferase
VEGHAASERWSEDEVRRALEEGLARGDRLKSLAADIAKRAGWSSRDVYRLGLR